MPLSRLENFIKNVEGTILYVNPTDQDATDSIENQGNSLTRPFKTIQRALIEAARFSFVAGKDNDKFDKTTIIVYPGVHKIDNRAGLSIDNNGGSARYKDRFGNVVSFSELTSSSNFDIEDSSNVLHYFNSVSGGVIIPRGTSLVGMDLRKTKIFPMFVPDPQNSEIDRTAIFKVTGGCYFWQFSLFDGDPNGTVYKNYSTTRFTPNFSHHKLTCFEYADGNNTISLGAVTGGSAITNDNTDLDSYYFKVANAYGSSSGREIPSWPTNEVLQPKLAENQIVGAVQADPIGITSVFSTNQTDYTFSGAVGRNIVVTTTNNHGLNVGTPIIVSGITTSSTATSNDPTFNAEGGAVVAEVLSDTQFAFVASEDTVVTNPHLSGDETVQVEPDTVTGASPYIFNLSLRSVYGVNGLHADGSKATGFKSMVLAQFTGIGLQKDDNAFLLYNESTGTYNDTTTVAESEKPLHINSKAIYKPDYESIHVKTSNSAILQCVSIFAIGFSQHFVADTGGDQSITNSNSNFGAKALIARGFRDTAFARDNSGYITHIIPPKSVTKDEESNFWVPLNVGLTTEYTVGSGTSDRLYTFGYTDQDVPPTHIIDQFRIGSKVNDQLKLEVNNQTKTAEIIMEGSSTATNQKVSFVSKNTAGTANSITESSGSIFGLTGNHEFDDGETVRILSDDGTIPDGIELDQKYFVIKTGLNGDQIKLAKTFNEAVSSITNPIENVNTTGGSLRIISAVSDKFPGDAGHPLQYDDTRSNWYINVKGDSTNKIYEAIEDSTSNVTSKSFISRKSDNRNLEDRIYKIRYVIPKEFQNAKPPAAGYVIQESSSTIVENQSEYSGNISNLTDFRNLKIIHDVDYDSNAGIATVTAELPHRLASGAKVKLNKVSSTNNTSATAKKGFNGTFDVASVVDSKTFTINIPSGRDPGTFLSNRPASVTDRDENHPNFSINEYSEVYYIYRVNEISEYQQDIQDGIYHLTCLLGSVNPSSSYFNDRGFSQNVVNLYPMLDRDNYTMDPSGSISIASNKRVSEVTTSDLTQSITKEFVNSLLTNNRYGFNITDAIYDSTTGVTTVTTDVQHNLNSVINVSIADSGSGYGFSGISTTIYNAKLTGGTGEGATIRFTTNTGGNFSLTSPIIVDGGSGYSVGDTLTVSTVGIPTFASGGVTYSEASLTVTSINQASENSIQIEDVIDNGEKNNEFNGVFRILDVPTSKKVSFLLPPSNSGIGTYKKNGKFIVAGSLSTITSIEYTDSTTGIVTVTCDSAHGLNIGNSFKIDYNDESSLISSIYNGTFIVNERVGLNTFTFYIGQGISTASAPSNVGYVLPTGYTAQEADSDISRENIFRRMNSFYVGISTTINGALTKSSTNLTLSDSSGFEKGDYIEIGTEIVRVKNTFSSNQADILRGLFGTRVAAITDGTLAKKIRPIPVEGRRYSILRASGHTFEYVGFGPGNYSNALPQRQDRILDKTEQLLSQSEKSDGGVVVYTGMNDSGDFYVGNRRLSSATGQEETIGIPVPRFVGDDGADTRLSVVFDDVTVKEFIKVEGGAGNIITSEFNGPVAFSNKVNFNSDKGADFKTITLKGTDANNTRRKYSVGISTPKADADNSVGDVVWKNDPVPGGYAGWIFAGEEGTEDNKWRKFGLIASEDAEQDTNTDSNIDSPLGNFTILPSKIGINTNIPQSVVEVKDGNTRLDTLYVAGVATFIDSVTLTTVNIDDLTVNDSLSVSGTISLDAPGGYTLSGNSLITGITTHTGDYDLVGGLQVENSASVGGTLTVSGHTNLNRNLQVSGNTSIRGALSVSGITTIGNKLNVSGNASVGGTLQVVGESEFQSKLSANTISASGQLTVDQQVQADGAILAGGTLRAGGSLCAQAQAFVNNNLRVSQNTQLQGDTSVGGTLGVFGNTSLDGTLTVSSGTTLKQTLSVSGNTDLNGTLSVCGNTNLSANLGVKLNANVGGTLCVDGNTQLKGNASVGGILGVNGSACVGGDTQLKSNASVGQNLRVGQNICAGGTLSVGGNTSLGGTLYVNNNAQLNGSLSVNNNVSIGGALTVAGESEFQSKLSANTISASGQVIVDQQVQADGDVLAGGILRAGGSLCAQGQAFVNNNFRVTQDSQLKGNASVGGRLDVAGQTSIGGNVVVKNSGNANIDLRSTASGVPHIDFARNVGGVAQDFGARLILRGDDQFDISGAQVRIGQNLQVAGRTVITGNLSVGGNVSAIGDATITGDVTVSSLKTQGRLQAGGNLSVTGTGTIKETLFVSGNASVGGTLCVEGQAFFNSDIDISGNTLYTGRLNVSGDVNLNTVTGVTTTRNLDVNGNLDASGLVCAGTLRVAGTTSLENLDVNGTASFAQSVDIGGDTTVGGILTVDGLTSLQGGLVVDTSMDVQTKMNANDISSQGQLTLGDHATPKIDLKSNASGQPLINFIRRVGGVEQQIGARLRLAGDSRFLISGAQEIKLGGSVSVETNLVTKGNTTLCGTLTVSGLADLNQQLQVSGNTNIGGTLNVAGATTLQSTLTVADESEFQSKLNANQISASGQVIVDGQVQADGAVLAGTTLRAGGSLCAQAQAFVNNDLRVSQNTQLQGNASVGGTLSVKGATVLSGGLTVTNGESDFQTKLNANTISFSGQIVGSNQVNIQGSVNAEQNINAGKGLSVCTNTQLKGNASVGGTLSVGGVTTLLDTLNTNDISASGVLTLGDSLSPHIELQSSASGQPYIDFGRQVGGVAQDYGARLRLVGDNRFVVSGATQIKLGGSVSVDNQFTVEQDTQLKGNASVGQTLTVNGNTDLTGTLTVCGKLTASSNLSVGGNTFMNGTLRVGSTLSAQDGLVVDGESDFQSKLNADTISASGQVIVDQQVQADGDVIAGNKVVVGGTLCAQAAAQINGSLRVTGNTTLCGTLTVCGKLTASSNLSVGGNTFMGGTLQVANESNFQSKLSANQISASGQVIVDGQVQADGAVLAGTTLRAGGSLCAQAQAFVNQDLRVTENTDLNGTLTVCGKLTASSNLSVGGNTFVGGILRVNSTLCAQGGLVVDGESDFQGKINADAISSSGNLIIGNQANPGIEIQSTASGQGGGYIDFSRPVNGTNPDYGARLRLAGDNRFVVSGATQIKLGGSVSVETNLVTNGNTTLRGTLTVSGLADLNQQLQVSGNTNIGGTLGVTGATTLGSTLTVGGATTLQTTLTVAGMTSLQGGLVVDTSCDIQTELKANKISSSNQILADGGIIADGGLKGASLQVTQNASVGGTLRVASTLSAQGGLVVDGESDFQGKINADAISSSGDITIGEKANPTVILRSNADNGLPAVNFARTVGGVAQDYGARLRLVDNNTLAVQFPAQGGQFRVNDGGICVGQNAIIKGNTTLCGTLAVSGATTLKNTLSVSAGTTLGQWLNVSGTTSIGGTLSVAGVTTLQNTLTVVGESDFQSKLNANTISASGQLKVKGQISTEGSVRVTQNLNAAQNLCVGETTQLKGNASVGGTLNVNSKLTAQSNLAVNSTTCLQGSLYIHGSTQAQGKRAFNQQSDAPLFGIRAWGRVNAAGQLNYGQNIAQASRPTSGNYRITFQQSPGNNNYAVVATVSGNDDFVYLISRENTRFDLEVRSDGGQLDNKPVAFTVIW